jgi:REP element-mobilizing transposase RayT
MGSLSFLRPARARAIKELVHRLGRRKGVRVYRYANSGNHLHLLVRARSPQAYKAFIRAVTGLIALLTLGAQRGTRVGLKFWDSLPFSRIVEWGRAFAVASSYLQQNELEALGFIAYRPRAARRGKAPPG